MAENPRAEQGAVNNPENQPQVANIGSAGDGIGPR